MSDRRSVYPMPRPFRLLGLTLAFVLLPLVGAGKAQGAAEERRAVIGKVVTPTGTVLARQAEGKPWQLLKQNADVSSGDLLLGMTGAALDTKKGTIRVAFLSELDEDSFYPIKETAVVLHDNPDVDLDFTLDRGRVDVTNCKDKGAAKVRVRFQKEVWDLTLDEPGTHVALELFGRWPKGARFTKKPKPEDAPALDLALIVLKGEVDRKCPSCQYALKAPPGPALMHWNSATGLDMSPKRLEKLPAWATDPNNPDLAKQKKAVLERFCRLAQEKAPGAVLEEFVTSDDVHQRVFAIFVLAALDDLPRLANQMLKAKYPDVRDNAVVALRHWIGRGPGQDLKLYDVLIANLKFTPGQAAIVLQLLHSFGDKELALPETYETLIEYLRHEKQPIRMLAHWHLVRLVPAGKDIPYDTAGSKEDHEKAYKEWKQLIPTGKMPPKPKKEDSPQRHKEHKEGDK